MQPTQLYDCLRSISQFGAAISLSAIDSGVVNRSYRLETQTDTYYVKTFDSRHIAAVDRQQVFSIEGDLAKIGVTPTPVYLDPKKRFQINNWVARQTVCADSTGSITRLADTLAYVHRLNIAMPTLDLSHIWEHYAVYIDKMPVALRQEMRKLQSEGLALTSKDVCCHNDLSFGHISCDEPMFIYDWEYAARGNRFFDIASASSINNLSAKQTDMLMSKYIQNTHLHEIDYVREFAIAKRQVSLTAALWTLAHTHR